MVEKQVTICFHFINHGKITEKSWIDHGHNIKFGGKSRSHHDIQFMVGENPWFCYGWYQFNWHFLRLLLLLLMILSLLFRYLLLFRSINKLSWHWQTEQIQQDPGKTISHQMLPLIAGCFFSHDSTDINKAIK